MQAEDGPKVYLVTETWCRDEGVGEILGAFTSRDKAAEWRDSEVERRMEIDPRDAHLDPEMASACRAMHERMLEVVEMPLDPARKVEELPVNAQLG